MRKKNGSIPLSMHCRDFNVVASPNEMVGGTPFNHNSARYYYEFLDRTYLMEIPSKGGTYNWSNQRSNEDAIFEKLDRALSSLEWSFLFPELSQSWMLLLLHIIPHYPID
ncbi:hypothetical protein V6N11_042826 [Hibiscus sabdariffa]|uniref:Uncharacterized protein n=1 Tax=Hibiscus sabdariffa TaxID=183260 RepID=A0ABR2QY40_9ROSI